MKIIDIDNWKGKEHYLWFKEYAHPYYNLTKRVDISKFYRYVKKEGLPFFVSLMYLVVKALNEIEEFRLRIVDEKVILYDKISPAFTMMTENGIYDNCEVEFDDFPIYLKNVLVNIQAVKAGKINNPKSYDEQNRQDQIYITSIPWIDFTSVTHPMTDNRNDSIPRIAWGKYQFEEDKVMISLGIQVHHAVVDGYPLAQGFLKIEEYLNEPEAHLEIE